MNLVSALQNTGVDQIGDVLGSAKIVAIVGLSSSPLRPSYGIAAYLQTMGYRVIPVNPGINGALGEKSYPTLLDVPEKIDIVNIFRRPDAVGEIIDQAIQLKTPCVWMQEEVVNADAAGRAEKAGLFVVMDRCILKEHRKRNR